MQCYATRIARAPHRLRWIDRLVPGLSVSALALATAACPIEVTTIQDDQRAARAPASAPEPEPPAAPPRPSPRDPATIRAEGNHLVGQPSPYLRQHAHNPVDWYPWGAEALERARREGKPIFLSVGYSTCHWCHVMEHESFEDDEVARLLNEHFISIKVDREQRPDIDAIYIDAVAAMGGSTGWPLNVFLTPQLQPYYGGTYFPRHARGGRPGFVEILEQVRRQWAEQGEQVARRGQQVLQQVEQAALAAVGAAAPLRGELVAEAIERMRPARDREHGGFGRSRKFPQSPLLLAHLRHVQRTDDPSAQAHLVLTLEQMMRSGLRDHLGGTFHRYTVDERWHLPHFEKTLYDNAQLAALYIDAGLSFDRPDLVDVGRGVLDDLLARWQQADGGFVVGFDADDPEGEGHYYSWTPDELVAALPAEDAALVTRAFGVTASGLAELDGRSVLHRQRDRVTAQQLGQPLAAVRAAIERSRPVLAQVRQARPPPGIDGKSLVAWNGLAIMALADAGRWLDEPRYREAARRAGAWVLDTAWSGSRLSRGSFEGQLLGDGVLDDHALAGLGLLRLHAATGELRWLLQARRLADEILTHFHDPDRHAFLLTRAADLTDPAALPVRVADFGDNALPSGGAAAVQLMLELGAVTGDAAIYDAGLGVLERAAPIAARRPYGAGTLLTALDHATAPVREVVIAGNDSDRTTAALWRQLARTRHARILPVRLPAAGPGAALRASFPALEGKRARRGRATAYVCERGRCQAPTSDPAVLRSQLAAVRAAEASNDDAPQ